MVHTDFSKIVYLQFLTAQYIIFLLYFCLWLRLLIGWLIVYTITTDISVWSFNDSAKKFLQELATLNYHMGSHLMIVTTGKSPHGTPLLYCPILWTSQHLVDFVQPGLIRRPLSTSTTSHLLHGLLDSKWTSWPVWFFFTSHCICMESCRTIDAMQFQSWRVCAWLWFQFKMEICMLNLHSYALYLNVHCMCTVDQWEKRQVDNGIIR